MIDIYDKNMYNLKHESTHQRKAEVSLHESAEISQGSRVALHRALKDRSGTLTPYRTNGYPYCKSTTLARRQNLGRRTWRPVTYPSHSIGYRQTDTLDASVNIIYLMRYSPGVPLETIKTIRHIIFMLFSLFLKRRHQSIVGSGSDAPMSIPRYMTC